jgi:DnaK suppressor protein
MKAADRAKIRKLLLALETELSGKTPEKFTPARASEVECADEDEQPLAEMLQSIASHRNQKHSDVLGRVQRALTRLAEEPDDFGACEECGDDLPLGRLAAMPYAELCVACQAKKDGPKGMPTRKKLTDYR